MPQRPNFIVIHTDQQRADCVGINGQRPGIYTPAIDSIGWQGANFTAAYASCPVCMPQRLTLLTGQLPEHHGLFDNVGIPYLPLKTTLPAEMRRGAVRELYKTIAVYAKEPDTIRKNAKTQEAILSFMREKVRFGYTELCEKFCPDVCSIEITFVNQNPKTTLILGHARAAAIVAVANKDIPVFEYEPNKIKKALTSAGHADKEQVYKMVRILLPAANPKTSDESDAIAIALAHANMSKFSF